MAMSVGPIILKQFIKRFEKVIPTFLGITYLSDYTLRVYPINLAHFDNYDLILDIATFPIDDISEGTTFKKQVLFIGGGESEYIPVHHHTDILELFPRYCKYFTYLSMDYTKDFYQAYCT